MRSISLLQKKASQKLFRQTLLVIVFCASFARLTGFVCQFGRESVQMDFSAFYAAGQAHRYSLSPYQNHPFHGPPVWDGVDVYNHSRFLYPPLVATFFQGFTYVSYFFAKHVWTLVSLICLIVALLLSANSIRLPINLEVFLISGTLVALFHPLLPLLERGQIDAVTLVLIMAALRPMIRHGKENLISGILLALATLLKLHVVFIVPFLILRKRWKVSFGYVLGLFLITLLTIVVNGWDQSRNYVNRELPRISAYGEEGTGEMRLSQEVMKTLRQNLPADQTIRDGRRYQIESSGYVANASLTRVLHKRLGKNQTPAQLSLFLLGFFVLVLFAWQWYHRHRLMNLSPLQELTYWQIVLAVVLLCAPLTWAMNTIWLLPAIFLVLASYGDLCRTKEAIGLALCSAGLFVAALPDPLGFHLLMPGDGHIFVFKYVFAEIVIFIALLFSLGRHES